MYPFVMPNQPKTPDRKIRVSEDLWRAAQAAAHNQGTTVSEVVRAALQEFVRQPARADHHGRAGLARARLDGPRADGDPRLAPRGCKHDRARPDGHEQSQPQPV